MEHKAASRVFVMFCL